MVQLRMDDLVAVLDEVARFDTARNRLPAMEEDEFHGTTVTALCDRLTNECLPLVIIVEPVVWPPMATVPMRSVRTAVTEITGSAAISGSRIAPRRTPLIAPCEAPSVFGDSIEPRFSPIQSVAAEPYSHAKQR